MTDFDDDDFDDDDGLEDHDCGADGSGKTALAQWQRCALAGTEYCDFDCRFSAAIRRGMHDVSSNAD